MRVMRFFGVGFVLGVVSGVLLAFVALVLRWPSCSNAFLASGDHTVSSVVAPSGG
jgi:hypothetical protein